MSCHGKNICTDTSGVVRTPCDTLRSPFHATLFMTELFGLASGGSPSFVALGSLISTAGFGSAGLPFPSLLRLVIMVV